MNTNINCENKNKKILKNAGMNDLNFENKIFHGCKSNFTESDKIPLPTVKGFIITRR